MARLYLRRLTMLGCWLALGACAHPRPPEILAATGGPVRPFSPAVSANGFAYLSGQIGTDASGALVAGGILPETRQTMDNIGAVLQRLGLSFADVVKCTVFIADMREWDAMNTVYVTYFAADRRPARSALGASGLALNARVEIECIAAQRR